MDLNTDLKFIASEKLYSKLLKLDIKTLGECLKHTPYRYEIYKNVKKISQINENDNKAIVLVRIEIIQSRRSRNLKGNFTKAIVRDDTDRLEILWFNNPWIRKNIKVGDLIYLFCDISHKNGKLSIINPKYKKYIKGEKIEEIIYPIYKKSNDLTQQDFRRINKKIIKNYDVEFEEFIPEELLKKHKLPNLTKTIIDLHKGNSEEIKKASLRIIFQKYFLINLKNILRKEYLEKQKTYICEYKEKEIENFIKTLNFKLTEKQNKVIKEIIQDQTEKNPSNRLLEGDVGSGKTIVFLIAVLNILLNKKQASLMVPTSILSMQHYEKILELFKKYKFKIALLNSKNSLINNEKVSKKEIVKGLKNGEINFLIGTHSVIQSDIEFKNLAFVVVDEQHKFGVNQRKKIKEQNFSSLNKEKIYPNFLSVSATPIPRTLHLAIYSDLKLSILDEKPEKRLDIKTKEISSELTISKKILKDMNFSDVNNVGSAYLFIKKEIKKGNQAYVICPIINEPDLENSEIYNLEIKSAKEEYKKISNLNIFKETKIGLLHGKLKDIEKNKIREDFLNKKIDILVSTSVVEVGVDIKDATCILIKGSERFGLSSLYQLRGRVGRSDKQSYCFVSGNIENENTKNRIQALIKAKNSFELAEFDMKNRGVGDFYGIKQSGNYSYNINKKILEFIKKESIEFYKNNNIEKYPKLLKKIKKEEIEVHME
ncbi:ATP-dependent DNA helicase RecG [Patescibacteria group bacterium]|nr:ATP-dependent DNA helicase RecG [Patescibacteria group bacterium]